ncbi:MAG: hypothetical protein WD738_03535 [Pirellulales bacterium]
MSTEPRINSVQTRLERDNPSVGGAGIFTRSSLVAPRASELPSLLAPRSSELPSRYANPFATCWTRPGALPFRFADGQGAEQLVEKLAAQNWQGAIVGPHGSGKSTLLETLRPALQAAGCEIQSFAVRNGCATACGTPFNVKFKFGTARSITFANLERQAVPHPESARRPFPRAVAHTDKCRRLILIDGYDQLGWFERLRLTRLCRRQKLGLLVTAHGPLRIPTLIRLEPGLQLVQQLVAELAARVSTSIGAADVNASHACYGCNVREIFFDLYDRHESLRHAV